MAFGFSELLAKHAAAKILIISKSQCPFCVQVKDIFKKMNTEYTSVELDHDFSKPDMATIQDEMQQQIGARTVPQVFINQKHVGDCSKITQMHSSGQLQDLLSSNVAKYKFAVIGGGSGGVAAIKRAASLRPSDKFIIFDYVSPTSNILGTQWDIGGCCVNVGCIPKKLFHKAGMIGHTLADSKFFSKPEGLKSDWDEMRTNINMYIRSLNFATKSGFIQMGNVDYMNAKAKLTKPNEITYTSVDGQATKINAEQVLLATGTRPLLPTNLQPLKKHIITSDDLFWLPYEPQDTLVIGGGYVALESACFLASIGYNVTLIVRQIALRHFDRECSDLVLESCRQAGVRVHLCTSIDEIELIEPADLDNKKPGQFRMKCLTSGEEEYCSIDQKFNTVLVATGRYAESSDIYDEEAVPIEKNPVNKKLIAKNEATSVPNVYAIGDVLDGAPELTPAAVAAGRKLANRLFDDSKTQDFIDYENVATTIFTHDEYACVGLSEEQACERYGAENISVFRTGSAVLADSSSFVKFGKLICMNDESQKVLGIHFIGKDMGEILQPYSLLTRKNLKADSVINHFDFVWVKNESGESNYKKSRNNNHTLEPGKYAVIC